MNEVLDLAMSLTTKDAWYIVNNKELYSEVMVNAAMNKIKENC